MAVGAHSNSVVQRSLASLLAWGNQIDRQLAGARATRRSALFLVVPLFALFNWLAYREAVSVPEDVFLVVALVAPLANTVGYLAVSPLIANRRGKFSWLTLIAGYAILNLPSELLKVFCLNIPWTYPQGGGTSGPTAVPVVITSALIACFWFAVANLGVNWLSETRTAVQSLRAGQSNLLKLRDQASGRLSQELEVLKNQIETSLGENLKKLTQRISVLAPHDLEGLETASSTIRQLCNREVRALSAQISSQQIGFRDEPDPTLNLKQVILAILNTFDVKPIRLLTALLVVAIPYAFNNAGASALQLVLTGIAAGFAFVSVADKLRRRWFGDSGLASIFSGFLMYLVVAVFGTQILNLIMRLFPELHALQGFTHSLEWLLPVILMVLWVLIGIISGAQGAAGLATEGLAAQNLELQQETTKLQQRIMDAQTRAYRLLHGSVQGRLAAVSLALIAARDESDPNKAGQLLQNARAQMEQAQQDLSKIFVNPEGDDQFNFESGLQKLLKTWLNLLEIEFTQEPNNLEPLPALLGQEVLSAIQESITNAYRHSEATKVAITLRAIDDELQLVVENDVSISASSKDQSLGTGLLQLGKAATQLEFQSTALRAVLRVSWLPASFR